jgi:hypothetical protein
MLQKVYNLITLREEGLIPREHQHEVNPWLDLGSRENYLYFTLPVALNFQRSSPAMRQAALRTREDPETNYLFFPESIVQTEYSKIQKDLIKHKLWLQPNKHTQIRTTLCQTLSELRSNDPRKLLESHRFDVMEIQSQLRENKKLYPYLNGSKMCDYWMFIMSHYTDIQLQNKDKLSIIPDTHIQQASIVLWITTPQDDPETVKVKWFKLLDGSGIYPMDLHSMLWNRSRNGFKPGV